MNPGRNQHPIIALVSVHTGPSPQAVPLANAFLKSAAINTPVDIILVDFFIGQCPDECGQIISESYPAAVGFSMYAWNRGFCLDIAAHLRKFSPEIKLFAGGPEVTADAEEILKTGIFDFTVGGEGEIPFRTICERISAKLKIENIPGILLQGDTPTVPYTQSTSDLDEIPSPYLTGILDTRSYSGILWQLSRGCVFSCDFCFDSRDRSGVRRFSIERIEAELRHFESAGVSQVFVLDSTFNQDTKRAKTILKMIRRIAPKIHFHFEIRSEFIDREMAGLFATITCSLQIGLQSSDPDVLKLVGRAFRNNDFCSRINLLNESGAVFGFDLMYGLPGDTLQGFYNSLDFALALYPNHLDIFPLAVLPGTALRSRSSGIGLEHLSTPPYTLISSPTFSASDMLKAKQIATACDVFFTRGKAVAWFNGVISVIKVKPTDLLLQFVTFLIKQKGEDLDEKDLNDHEVWTLQRKFLTQCFSKRHLKRFQALVLDLVDYHYHYSEAILAPLTETSPNHKPGHKLLEYPLRRATCLQLARFNYEIMEIIEVGAPDILWMSNHLQALGSSAAIYPFGDYVRTQSIDDSYFKLLELLDGQTIAGELASKLGISSQDAAEFLEFAMQEGFIDL